MTTADEVLNAKFQATKFGAGYDQDEVDDFLDRVVATLRAREGGAPAPQPVTVADIDACSFTATKWREGYAPKDVDALLDRVRAELGATSPTPARASAAGAPAGAIPGMVVETRGRWRRLFGG